MPSGRPSINRSLREDLAGEASDNVNEATEPPAKRRRVFLQTMGQQLREVGQRDEFGETASSIAGSTGDAHSLNNTSISQGRHVQIQTPESDAVPGEDEQLPTGATMSASKALWRPGEVMVEPTMDGSENFTFEDILTWTRSYFDHWHPAYPFLHAPSMLEYFDQVVDRGVSGVTGQSLHQLTILRSIISVSLADCRQTGFAMKPVPPQLVFTSLNHAIQSVQCLLTDESSMISLQAVVSVQLFLISMLRYNAASRLEGLAVRMAFHLGLHRCPMQFSALPKKEAELRQRLFWSMYCIDRYVCIRLGIPLAIRDSEIDVCLPSSEKHGAHRPSDSDSRLDLLGFLARHAKIRGTISELRNKSVSNRQTESDEAVVIGAELTKWWNEIDEYLDSNNSELMPIRRYHQVTLAVLRQESIIALNKHTLATSTNSSAYDAALQNCIAAARSIISSLHSALIANSNLVLLGADEVPENSGLLWPSFTWAVWMSAFLMIYAANEDQVPQDVAIRLTDRALEVLKHLTLRESLWPNACAAAIRDLRGQLVDQRNRSKHTYTHNRNVPRAGIQGASIPNTHSRPNPVENNNADPPTTSHGSIESGHQQSMRTETPFAHDYHRNRLSQDTRRVRDMASTQDNLEPPFAHNITSEGFTNAAPSPFTSRLNWMFSENMPSFGDTEGNGYAFRMGAQFQPELQIPNHEGAELMYGLDTPFWVRNDQWMGTGGSS